MCYHMAAGCERLREKKRQEHLPEVGRGFFSRLSRGPRPIRFPIFAPNCELCEAACGHIFERPLPDLWLIFPIPSSTHPLKRLASSAYTVRRSCRHRQVTVEYHILPRQDIVTQVWKDMSDGKGIDVASFKQEFVRRCNKLGDCAWDIVDWRLIIGTAKVATGAFQGSAWACY